MAKAPVKKALPARGTRTAKHNTISAPAMDKKWQAQDDLHHLKRAEEVKSDPSRLKAAQAEAKAQLQALQKVAKK